MRHPRFRITKGTGDEYTFNLTARAVASVKENAPLDARYEKRDARDGTFYFVLKAGNGEIVGTSETYSSKSARDGGIESVKVNAPVAAVEG
jgi:uncharacterized protein YegP (UPF0339 family)